MSMIYPGLDKLCNQVSMQSLKTVCTPQNLQISPGPQLTPVPLEFFSANLQSYSLAKIQLLT